MNFTTSYSNLPENFFKVSKPAKFSAPKLLAFNHVLAETLGFSADRYTQEDLAGIFSGQKVLEGSSFISMAYAAHQFGNFVPQLGDGRAMLLGEVIDDEGKRFDVQLKGSGPTFFSRRGDGFSALGPVIREYIVSEAMYHLGVPTTRAMAAVLTGDDVYRERPSPGGVFTRVASSHIRIGTFQYFASRQDFDSLKLLFDYVLNRHHPHLIGEKDQVERFLREVIQAQVKLVTHWMSLGFIHGVMNTDNMTISGETIDYGPCAFMDHFRYDKVYSYIDQQGRYRYENQKGIMMWNLARLAECLIPLCEVKEEEAVEILNNELYLMSDLFDQTWTRRMTKKFGFESNELKAKDDESLVKLFLDYLEKEKLDFTSTFRSLSKLLQEEAHQVNNIFPQSPELDRFKEIWTERLRDIELDMAIDMINKSNPVYIPRNHLVERAIQHAEEGDYEPFHQMNLLLTHPFENKLGYTEYEKPPLPSEEVINTFCGT